MNADDPLEITPPAITRLLVNMRAGDAAAKEKFVEAVYQELKKIARQQLRGEPPGHSVQASALVNDLYVKMLSGENGNWENRAHFFTVAASNMRRILIDRARRRRSLKRGGELLRVDIDEQFMIASGSDDDESSKLLALDDALNELARLDERQARIVEMRFFAGLTSDEAAEALGISRRTVMREWAMARAWLHDRVNTTGARDQPRK
jgi:RNA polymerase sigma factor (TIGR02999 family)